MEGFEEFMKENFPDVTDPMTLAVARCTWNGCWKKVIEDYKKNQEDDTYV